ncbi:hypothetical protein EV401DRAFT_1858311, partial [Pisolithus croceorrhizus]
LATAMRENEWPEDRINNHVKFWLVLEGHTWWHGHCEISKGSLLTYQAHMRHKWHDTLATPHSFNIALINPTLLLQIRDKLVHLVQVAQLELLKQVSPPHLPPITIHLTEAPPPLLPPSFPSIPPHHTWALDIHPTTAPPLCYTNTLAPPPMHIGNMGHVSNGPNCSLGYPLPPYHPPNQCNTPMHHTSPQLTADQQIPPQLQLPDHPQVPLSD